jgi:hypothetical protein
MEVAYLDHKEVCRKERKERDEREGSEAGW